MSFPSSSLDVDFDAVTKNFEKDFMDLPRREVILIKQKYLFSSVTEF
jgi:hypothetical protein